ncbi:alpha/beta hydrolase fold protein [Kribbella flavida DSM 17836]|uniref:Alpha/beta hydrolase fold protein n=1 Tax=Kribbella flavida (strain DSM 17836 / JCM 10339 / NBRC 14399) TaxID=479435 RepID=D2PQY0_KRIFD|nr:alpha/beta hydrolase [Kribbella flavida]ADB31113.1 alpha/beta hydrolase fold protein [Kribbella flavida DSM 17836]
MTSDRKKRRWPRIALGVVVVAGVAVALVVRSPSPVGHWNSADGYADYAEKYDRAMKDLPTPTLTRDLRTEYGVVRVYRFTGTGARTTAPLVLLPGTSSGTPVWADNLPSLLRIGDVYTFDLLGEPGMSVQSRPIDTSEDKAAWLDQTLAALPEQKFNVVGLSIGGWTAVNLALRHPDRVATLTTLDAVNVFGSMPVETIVRSLPAAVKWLPRSWRDSFNSYTAGGAPVEQVPVADMIESGMKNYTIRQSQPERISEQQLAGLPMPVLAIIAGKSVMHDPPKARSTAESALRTKTVKFYPDASHALNGEFPDRIAADLQAFLTAQR